MGRLTATAVRGLRAEGKYFDGQGLALVVNRADQRYWQFRFQRAGHKRVMSFGNDDDVTLADARKLHAEARALLLAGKDPLEERDRGKVDLTRRFADVAEAYIADHEVRWHGPRSASAVAQQLARLRLSIDRQGAGRGDWRAARPEGPATDLGQGRRQKAGDRQPGAQPHRDDPGLRLGYGLAAGSEPGDLARRPEVAAARQVGSAHDPALRGDGLARVSRVHGRAAQARRHGSWALAFLVSPLPGRRKSGVPSGASSIFSRSYGSSRPTG